MNGLAIQSTFLQNTNTILHIFKICFDLNSTKIKPLRQKFLNGDDYDTSVMLVYFAENPGEPEQIARLPCLMQKEK